MKELLDLLHKLKYSKALVFSLIITMAIVSAASISSESKAQNAVDGNFVNNNAPAQTNAPLNNNMNNNTTSNNSLLNLNGSLPVLPITTQALLSHLNTTMNQATIQALNEVGKRSIALTNTLDIVQGFLAYKVIVVDGNENLHEVLVDSGNGKVLFSSTNIIDKNLVPSFLNGNQLANSNMPMPYPNNP